MTKASKYTTNFVDRTKPDMYSGDDIPEYTSADAGKALTINEQGNIIPGESGDLPEPFVVHFDYDKSHNLVVLESWLEIIEHGRNVVAYYTPAEMYAPLCQYEAGRSGFIEFRLLIPATINDANMTYGTPIYYRLGVADGSVWGGEYIAAGRE